MTFGSKEKTFMLSDLQRERLYTAPGGARKDKPYEYTKKLDTRIGKRMDYG